MSEKPMILGIDPSITHTAICSGREETAFHIETFASKPLGDTPRDRVKRYEVLAAKIDQHVRDLSPDLIVIEGYSFGSKSSMATQTYLAEWGGILRWHLSEHTPYLFEVAPTTLKKYITGKGTGKKEMMIAHVAKKWGQIFPSNDHVDAFCLWRLGLAMAGTLPAKNQAERDSVSKVLCGITLNLEPDSTAETGNPPF